MDLLSPAVMNVNDNNNYNFQGSQLQQIHQVLILQICHFDKFMEMTTIPFQCWLG